MKYLLLMISMFVSSYVVAKDWTESISCGNAIIDISISEKEEGIKIWEVELNARSKYQNEFKSTLRYDQVYFSFSCEKTIKGKDYFVYHAYCSGSGCSDNGNWGIIDNNGKLLLVPYSENLLWKEAILKSN